MAKTVSFAATHFTVAFGVAYALTGDVVIGGTLALAEPAVNTVAYHFHEKIWSRIRDRHRDRHGDRREDKSRARGWQTAASPPIGGVHA